MKLFALLIFLSSTVAGWGGFGQSVAFQAAAAKRPADGGGGGGEPAFVEFANSAGSASASSQTIALTVASGATIVVGAKWEDASRTVTVSDTGGNTYTPLWGTNAASQIYAQMFYTSNAGAASLTITVNYGATTAYVRAGAFELSGCSASAPLDINPQPGSTTASDVPALQTSAGTTANAVEVLIAFGGNYLGTSSTPQASWTEVYDPNAFSAEYRVTTSAGSYYGTHNAATEGASEIALFAAFK